MTITLRDCRWPWNRSFVFLNGDVKPCCYAQNPVGNLGQQSLREIWHGKEMNDLRDSLVAGRLHRVCVGASCAYVRADQDAGAMPPDQVRFDDLPDGVVPESAATLARLGQGASMFLVGRAYLLRAEAASADDPLTPRQNYTRCVLWLRRAARAASPFAANLLASLLYEGKYKPPTTRTDRVAFAFARSAAAANHGGGLLLLGTMYAVGRGTAQDSDLAADAYGRAGDAGDPSGYHYKGMMLSHDAITVEEGQRLIRLARSRGYDAPDLAAAG